MAERVVNVHEARTHFSRLIDAVHAGETILLAKGSMPWARLVPLEQLLPRRQAGVLAGRITLPAPELLPAPLLEEELAALDLPLLWPCLLSAASGWEIATKVRLGKLPGVGELLNNLPQLLIAQGFELLPHHAATGPACRQRPDAPSRPR